MWFKNKESGQVFEAVTDQDKRYAIANGALPFDPSAPVPDDVDPLADFDDDESLDEGVDPVDVTPAKPKGKRSSN